MIATIKLLMGKSYYPLNQIEISKTALVKNYTYLSTNYPAKIAPVLKSNAYGHGIELVASVLDPLHPAFFCVDSIYEAYQLIRHKIKTKILIMGYINPANLKVKKLPFSYAVCDQDTVKSIKRYQPHAGIHLFVDTGMHREGISMDKLPDLIRYTQKLNLHIEGIMSHFGDAGNPNNPKTTDQVNNFRKVADMTRSLKVNPDYLHISASNVIASKNIYGNLGNLIRAGIALYGIPVYKNINLHPVMQVKSTIVGIKTIQKGESIGYDFTYTAKSKMRIATLPIGYNDGVDLRLSNTGFIKIKRNFCPIVGRVSMNISVIDVSQIKNLKIGDSVTVFSNNQKDANSISKTAIKCQTIPYELLIHLHPSIKRILL
jgi:alanine racemase